MEITRDDYFNKFDSAKAYQRLIFLAGRPLQSAELNEMQDMIIDLLAKVSKHLVSNGTIISGGEVTSLSTTSISLNNAVVALEGIPTNCAAGSITIPEVGVSVIGVAVKSLLITGNDDIDLFEQDPQSPHFGGDGAYREKRLGTWKVSTQVSADEVFFPVMSVSEGTVISSSASTSSDSNAIGRAISKYDNGVHGSYVVNGLDLAFLEVNEDTGTVDMTMSSGIGRIAGTEKQFQLESIISLDPITDFRSVSAEPIVFQNGVGSYALRNTPLMAITEVTGTKVITHSVTRGAASGGQDLLSNTPVLMITSVVQGGTTYIKDVDFKQTGDSVDWSLAGAEPSPGSSYTVTYQYIDTFSATFTGNNLTLDAGDVAALVHNSTMYIDYDFYLSRVDRVLLDRDGNVQISRGIPGTPSQVQPNQTPNDGFLSIGTVTVSFGSDPVIDQDSTVRMMTFAEMKVMGDRLDSIEYNIAQLSLKDVASGHDPVTTKKGIVVDSLANDEMRDAGVVQNAINVDATLYNASNMTDIEENVSQTFSLPQATEYIVFQNQFRTKSQRINPYAGNGASLQADIVLAPSVIKGNAWWWWWHGTFLPRSAKTTVQLARFQSGETVQVRFRGKVVASGTANVNGALSVAITVPDRTPYGVYEVTATGLTSQATAKAALTVSGRDDAKYNGAGGDFSKDYWNGGEIPLGADPVAQTFLITKDADLSAVSVFLTELPTNTLFIKLVPVTLGIPDSSQRLAIGSLSPNQCVIGWNKINFKVPRRVYNGSEYAVIVSTANFQGKVATARVGEYDSANAKWISNQVLEGVMLLSANERTWTPVQDEDLTMRLHAKTYATSGSYKILSMSDYPNNATEFNVGSVANIPAGTNLKYTLKVGSVSYDLALSGNTVLPPIPLASAPVELWATMSTSDPSLSPYISQGVALFAGTVDTPAEYVQRTFQIPNGTVTPVKLTVIIDEYAPVGSSINVYYKNGSGNWVGMSKTGGTALGDGREAATYEVTNVAQNSSAIRIVLNTTSYTARPEVKNIRTLIS
jgi:hypothetical protein